MSEGRPSRETVPARIGPAPSGGRPLGRRCLLSAVGAGIGVALGALAPPPASAQLFGADPIFEAIEDGDAEALNREILGGAFVNGRDGSGRTPLIAAVQAARLGMVDLLIGAGALIDDTDRTGNTALAWAAQEGNAVLTDRLLEAGAAVDTQNRQGMTPLMLAAREGRIATAERLLEAGARLDVLDYTGRSAADWSRGSRNSRLTRLLGG